MRRITIACGALAFLAGWSSRAMVPYNEVLHTSNGATISVAREVGELPAIKLAPAGVPDDAVTARLSDTERLELITMLEGAVP